MTERNELREALAMAALARGVEEFRQRAAMDDSLGEAFPPVRDEAVVQLIEEAWELALPANGADAASGAPVERLEFVTERIAVSEANQAERAARHHYPLKPLALSEEIFCHDAEAPVAEALTKLWRGFKTDLARVPSGGFQARFDTLLHLMQKYAWCIRSTTDGARAAVSLYDHTRTAAAIAICLLAARQENQSSDAEFLLIEAGISGIQQFIYSPTFNGQELQDGMARRLRGRSFYLNLLVKTLADSLTMELGLCSANTLWATGGQLLIIAPNTAATRETLAAARKRIQQWLWREYRGALGVVISDLAAARDELKNFGGLRQRLEQVSARQKLQLADLPLNFAGDAPDEAWADAWVLKMQQGVCRDTGRDLSPTELEISAVGQYVDEDESETPAPRSPQSLLFDAIGRALINARTIQLRRANSWLTDRPFARLPHNTDEAERLTGALKEVLIEFEGLNRSWLLSDKEWAVAGAESCLFIADHHNVELEFLPANPALSIAYGFEMMATAVAIETDKRGRQKIKAFDKLAELADGAKYLGALRMDVDDLGYMFARGLPAEERSIAKIANLSRMLDWFFAGYLNTLVAGKPLYTTYAGGDDLFVVGAWDETLKLADTIQSKFKTFCGDNPDLHISAGIALCRGKYPLGRAAEDAAVKLNEIAKTASVSALYPDKAALAFLERKVPWGKWPELLKLGNDLIKAVEDKRVSRKFIYHLLRLFDQHIDPRRDPLHEKRSADLVWLPKFLYSLVRNVSDKTLCVSLQTSIPNHQDYLSVLAGYVLLKTRSRQTQSPAPDSAATPTDFRKELI